MPACPCCSKLGRYQNLSDAEEAKKLRDARRFAKGLFHHVRSSGTRPYIIRDDFSPFFASKEGADAAFGYFDKDNDATISLKEMKDSVVAIFKVSCLHAHQPFFPGDCCRHV